MAREGTSTPSTNSQHQKQQQREQRSRTKVENHRATTNTASRQRPQELHAHRRSSRPLSNATNISSEDTTSTSSSTNEAPQEEVHRSSSSRKCSTERITQNYKPRSRRRLRSSSTTIGQQDQQNRLQKWHNAAAESFAVGRYLSAIRGYSRALNLCDPEDVMTRSVLLANRAANLLELEAATAALQDCQDALQSIPNPHNSSISPGWLPNLLMSTSQLEDSGKQTPQSKTKRLQAKRHDEIHTTNPSTIMTLLRPILFFTMTQIYVKMGDLDQAQVSLDAAVSAIRSTKALSSYFAPQTTHQTQSLMTLSEGSQHQLSNLSQRLQRFKSKVLYRLQRLDSQLERFERLPQVRPGTSSTQPQQQPQRVKLLKELVVHAPASQRLISQFVSVLAAARRWWEVIGYCERFACVLQGELLARQTIAEPDDATTLDPLSSLPFDYFNGFFVDGSLEGARRRLPLNSIASAIPHLVDALLSQLYLRALRLEGHWETARITYQSLCEYCSSSPSSSTTTTSSKSKLPAWLQLEKSLLDQSHQAWVSGERHFRKKDFRQATTYFQMIVHILPENGIGGKVQAQAFAQLGSCWQSEECFDKAIAAFSQALRIHPLCMDVLRQRSQCYGKVFAITEAIADLHKWTFLYAQTTLAQVLLESPVLYSLPTEMSKKDLHQVIDELDRLLGSTKSHWGKSCGRNRPAILSKQVRGYCEILGLETSASANDAKKAYRRLILQYHPDKNQYQGEDGAEKFRQVQEAWEALREVLQ